MDFQAANEQKWLSEWEPPFRERCNAKFTHGPVEQRKIQDMCCFVTFFVLLGLFVGVGGYCIQKTVQTINDSTIVIEDEKIFGDPTQLRNFILSVTGFSLLSLVMCVLFVLLTKNYPKLMVYTVIGLVSLIFVAGAVVFFVAGVAVMSILLLIAMALYFFLLCYCFRKHVKTAIVLVKVTGTFLTERPIVYVIPVVMTLLTFVFTMLWVGSITGLIVMGSAYPPPLEPNLLYSLYTTQAFLFAFFTFFSYYVMVFLVAVCVAIWYYQSEKSMLGSGLKWLVKGHLGSITFAALIITIIKMLLAMAKKKKTTNTVANIARLACVCLLKVLEKFVKIMNRYSVIIMSFTGEDFLTCCKSTGVLIFKNIGVFSVLTIVSGFFYYSGIFLCTGIPTAIAGAIANQSNMAQPWMAPTLVFFCSLIISNIFLTTFSQTLTSVFVFYSLDLQLKEYGIDIVNVPSDMQLLLQHAFDDSEDYRESFLEKAKLRRAGEGSSEDINHPSNTGQYVPPPMYPTQPQPQPTYTAPPPQYYPPPPPGYQPYPPAGYYAQPPQGYPYQPPQGYPAQPPTGYYPPPPPPST